MTEFTITANECLNQDIQAFYHVPFYGSRDFANSPTYLYKLKNDPHHTWDQQQLSAAVRQLSNTLQNDFPEISKILQVDEITVCAVPRAKANHTPDQLLFQSTVGNVANRLVGFSDGTAYIMRHTNTRTTHLRKPIAGYTNDGPMPYAGITLDTCTISNNVEGRDILLVDDIYTPSVGIDEDAIQALLDSGAKSVTFYSIGHTM